ncbi:hypothetical protein SDC9_74523 [bioreactor metagenome]|uniref:N-acetyltransferase domain-containing protein n=1 Tax=bioreactor metagenome TaxID=1076179 RepID=A0A644YHM9_9ZZZZ
MYQIRKAAPNDALGITIVNIYTWKTTYSGLMPDDAIDLRIAELKERAEKCKADIEQNNNFIVAEVDHTIVGFCVYGKARNDNFKESGEIFALYALKGFQGMGIGKALFLAGVNELRIRENTSMIINCLQGNPALEFYKHMGGKIAGQRQDEIKGKKITEDIIYYKDINSICRADERFCPVAD